MDVSDDGTSYNNGSTTRVDASTSTTVRLFMLEI